MRQSGDIQGDVELQRVLCACFWYWESQQLAAEQRVVCYSWVRKVHQARFGVGFHQSKLRKLAALGFLARDETTRRGSRRYYRIVGPDRVAALLKHWQLL